MNTYRIRLDGLGAPRFIEVTGTLEEAMAAADKARANHGGHLDCMQVSDGRTIVAYRSARNGAAWQVFVRADGSYIYPRRQR